jgi:hypothetical protein
MANPKLVPHDTGYYEGAWWFPGTRIDRALRSKVMVAAVSELVGPHGNSMEVAGLQHDEISERITCRIFIAAACATAYRGVDGKLAAAYLRATQGQGAFIGTSYTIRYGLAANAAVRIWNSLLAGRSVEQAVHVENTITLREAGVSESNQRLYESTWNADVRWVALGDGEMTLARARGTA